VPGGARLERKTLLIVGASFVEASIYPQHILDLSRKEGAVPLRLLGSRGAGNMPPTTDLRHEGYSGWTAEAFATMSGPLSRSGYHNGPGTGSPFLYQSPDGMNGLDFARYCDEFNGGDPPSFVTIDLGGNDIFYANDETIDATIDRMFEHYDAVVDAIRKAGPKTRIGVLASTPPSTSQDGFRNYLGAGKKTQWQFHRNIHRLIERKIEHYDNRMDEGIYLVPTYVNLDTEHHFPTFTSLRNDRSGETSTRVSNGTHPSPAGYQQIGDSIYAWIVASTRN
jgi:lysophospholipase L1-like esterase